MNQRPLADYVTVAERLTVAAPDIEAITTSEPQMLDGPMGYIRAVVKMKDGRTASGTASFRLDLTGGRAQATNPLEDAETSAVGRALAFLGYETKRGVASREEVAEAQRRAEHSARAQPPADTPRRQPGSTVAGIVSGVQQRRVKNGSVLIVEFTIGGEPFVYYNAPDSVAELADGHTLSIRPGKPNKEGTATYVDEVLTWMVPAEETDDIPF